MEDLRHRGREDHRNPGRGPLAQGPAGQDGLRDGGEGRLVRGHAGRGVRGDGPVRVGQVDADPAAHPAHRAHRRPGGDERRGDHRGERRPAARAAPPPRGHGVPALRAAPAPQGDRQRRLRAGGARRGEGAAPHPGQGDGRPGRPDRLRGVLPGPALRGHAAARRAGQGAGRGPAGAHVRRAVLRAGPADPPRHAERGHPAARGGRQDDDLHYARPAGGAQAG